MKKHIQASLVLLSLTGSASAQAITGRVVDANGNGVASVNIDAVDASDGSLVALSSDGTDGNGFFTTTVDPGAGVYRFLFFPPPPPAGRLLVGERNNVVVVGTTNLGNVVLSQGFALSGTTRRTSGTPVANVDLDVIDPVTHQELVLQGDTTDAFGAFSLAVPQTPIQLRFRTDGITPLLAPRVMELDLSADTNLGTVTLQPGFVLSGTVRRTNGTAVSSVDIDVFDAGGNKLFTPSDTTNSSGFVDTVVPSGAFEIEVCPPFSALLVGRLLSGVVVSGTTNLGTVTLQSGVVLSGTIRDDLSAPVQNADVDVRDSTGQAVVTCNDNSDAAGHYAVVVPTGTFELTYSPPGPGCTSGLGLDVDLGVVVNGSTTHDAVLPAASAATAASFVGDGINADTLTPVKVVLGANWTAPLSLGHPHGTGGVAVLKIRTGVVNGPNTPSPMGGRLSEILISGPLLGVLNGAHDGSTGGIAPQPIPDDLALGGLSWAAQYTVSGGGFVDLSRAAFGVVGCQ